MVTATMAELGIDPVEIGEMLDRNMTFPARWYSDPRIYEFELERIFTRTWQLAGPLHKLRNPGDYIVCQAAHIPIVVTRDLEGELHGFVNVCRHRAYPVALEDGHRKALRGGALRQVGVLARSGRRRHLERVRLRQPESRRASVQGGPPRVRVDGRLAPARPQRVPLLRQLHL
jgi:hypothetical protein